MNGRRRALMLHVCVLALKNSAAMDTPKATRAQALPGAQHWQLVAGTGRERGSTGAHARSDRNRPGGTDTGVGETVRCGGTTQPEPAVRVVVDASP
jgi:hypothetical protein